MGIAKEDTKVYFVLVLNYDTLSHLDAYVPMHGGNEMAHLETVHNRLHHVLYILMLAYLEGKLSELAR